MKIIIPKPIYECEICGNRYETEDEALFCETANPLPPCPVNIGDLVHIRTRYDGIAEDVVCEIGIVPRFAVNIESWYSGKGLYQNGLGYSGRAIQ